MKAGTKSFVRSAIMAFFVALAATACSNDPQSSANSTTTEVTVAEGTAVAWIEPSSLTVSGGEDLGVTIVVMNRTGAPISIASCGPVFYGVGFESDSVARTDPPFLTCLGPPIEIPVGESRHPNSARAAYRGCGGTGVEGPPACVDGRAPALPPGEYRLVVGSIDRRAPIPTPVVVTVE